MVAKVSIFKGRPTLSLKRAESDPDMYSFTFGVAKAELILQHIDEIKLFAASHQVDKKIDFKSGETP